MSDFYQFLADNRIEYQRFDHPAVYTVAEAKRLVPPLPVALFVPQKEIFGLGGRQRRHQPFGFCYRVYGGVIKTLIFDPVIRQKLIKIRHFN